MFHLLINLPVLSDHRTGILTTDISDHLPIFAIVDLYTTKKQFDVNYIKHDFSCTNIQHFIQDLHETNWDFITTSDDVNDNYSIFCSLFYNCTTVISPRLMLDVVLIKIIRLG